MIFNKKKLKNKFTEVYLKNLFKGQESKSGEGSSLLQTKKIREQLPILFKKFQISSLVDAPCGDWNWMAHVNLSGVQYLGLDIVEEVVAKNISKYKQENINFQNKDLTSDSIDYADLILCRDCFMHLCHGDIKKILNNFKDSGAKFILTTTFLDRNMNSDLNRGFWRPLNLQIAPFNFPDPLYLINEECTEANSAFKDKSLGLWVLKDISF
jgi:SAM-dependent methyltransferase